MTPQRTAVLTLLTCLGCWALFSAAPVTGLQASVPGLGDLPAAPLPLPPLPAVVPGIVRPEDPPVPVVAIRVRVLAAAAPEQEIEYRLCVHNLSPADAHHVLVRNPLPANARFVRAVPEPSAIDPEVQWQLGTLPGGAVCEIVLVLAPTDANDVKNCARVRFEHGQCVTTRIVRSIPIPVLPGPGAPPVAGVPPGAPSTAEPPLAKELTPRLVPVPKAGAAKLHLKITGPKQQYANLPARYQITVSNPGTAAATNVAIANPLPPGTTLVDAGSGGRFHANQVAWLLGDLDPGASRTVQLILRAAQAGTICDRASAVADGGLKAAAEACTEFKGVSALALDVDDSVDPVPVGKETSYTITVTNQGTAAVTSIRIRAIVPPEVELLRASGASGPPPKDKLPAPGLEGQALPFAPLKSLAPGAVARYEIAVRAVQAGDVRFKVEMTADQLEAGPVRVEESTRIFAADEAKLP